jgi:hypothetical protein
VFDIFKLFAIEGPGSPFAKPFDRKRNGGAAYKAFKSQAEGRSAIHQDKGKGKYYGYWYPDHCKRRILS